MNIVSPLVIAAFVLAGCGSAPLAEPVVQVVPSASVADANRHIVEAAAELARIDERFADQEQVCYKRFFVNDCLDRAKDERHAAAAVQNAKDNEAQRYLRQAALNARDAEIAKAQADYAANEAKLAQQAPRVVPQVTEAPPPKPSSVPGRVAERAAREKAAAAKAQAEAPQRAANVAAAAKRRAESARRQKEVAARKAR